jgi:hypothetical protein
MEVDVGDSSAVAKRVRSSTSFLCHRHLDIHGEIIVRCTDKAPSHGNGLADVSGYSNSYQVAAADRPVGRVVGNPPCAWNINVGPSMGRPGTDGMTSIRRTMEISRHDPCAESETACGLDQQHGQIAARAPTAVERLDRGLSSFRVAALVRDRQRRQR